MTLFHLLLVALAVWMLTYLLRPAVKQAFAPAQPLAAPRTDHAAAGSTGDYRAPLDLILSLSVIHSNLNSREIS